MYLRFDVDYRVDVDLVFDGDAAVEVDTALDGQNIVVTR